MTHIGLFEGIGGFSLAARWMEWETIAWCEWNEYCKKILTQHFPNAKGHGDIKKTDFSIYRGQCDIVTGGFPCQPYSQAGKRLGKKDDRHLWPEMLRAIREIQPHWVVGENVSGLLNWNGGMVLDEIKVDLETAGFEVFPPLVLPACGVNAPHKRDRVWIIAHANSNRKSIISINENTRQGELGAFTNTNNIGCKGGIGQQISREQNLTREFSGSNSGWGEGWTISEPLVCGVDDGIPNRLDRIKTLGNSIVPQVAFQIFKTIELYETTQCNI